jgi:hypothetical protein
MSALLLGVALAILALWILQPLRLRPAPAAAPGDLRWKELSDAKHAIYRSILDLDADRSFGKVSEEDYAILRRQHETEALGILRQMDDLEARGADQPVPESGLQDALEAEIAAARARLRPGP